MIEELKACPLCDQAIRKPDVAPPSTRIYLLYRNMGRIHIITIAKAVVAGIVLTECDWSESEGEVAMQYMKGELQS